MKIKTEKFLSLSLRIIVPVAFFFVLFPASAQADIYRFVDKNGIVHYTNIPTTSDYELFVREKPEKPQTHMPGNPNLYDSYIREAARTHRLDFDLIKAVVKVESNFNPRAVSKAGARGLMQIMPDNFSRLGIKDPYDPRQNIFGGAKYLGQMIDRFEGSLSLALAAYNAGPSAVEKYQRIPPFDETQRYVKKVIRQYYAYRQASYQRTAWEHIKKTKP